MSSKARKPLRSGQYETVEDVQKEALRRSKETGRRIRYAHIQIEETLQLYGGCKLKDHIIKKETKNKAKKTTKKEETK